MALMPELAYESTSTLNMETFESAEHRVDGNTRLCRWVGYADVGQRQVFQVHVDEVHVGIFHREVLCVESASRRTWEVHDCTSPRASKGVAVLDVAIDQRSHSVLWEVETGFINTIDREVGHGDNSTLATSVGEHRTNIGEGHLAHGVVTGVTVRSG